MAEEFQESEVIFSSCVGNDNVFNDQSRFDFREMIVSATQSRLPSSSPKNIKNNKKKVSNSDNYNNENNIVANSMPVNIPDSVFRFSDRDDLDEDWEMDGGAGEWVPPHVIVGRRIACGKMAYSVCTGNGRTLKGRDLSQVRNSILRMTGFLET